MKWILAGAIVLAAAPAALGVGLTNVPLHDPLYDDLQKLMALAGHTANLATLPISRLEAAGIVIAIEDRKDFSQLHADPLFAAIHERLARRLAKDIAYRRAEGNRDHFDTRFAPLQQAALATGASRTQSRFLQQFPFDQELTDPVTGLRNRDETFERPPTTDYGAFSGVVYFDAALELEDHLALFARPQIEFAGAFADSSHQDDVQELDMDIAYAKLQWFNVAASVGRDSLWWGPGQYGALMLSDNAPPLDLVKLQSHQAFRLPWVFRVLGPMSLTAFLAQLEEDRHVPNPYVIGGRMTLMPLDRVEIGVTRVIQFGGDGSGKPGLENLDDVLIGRSEHTYGKQGDTNQLAGFDARVTIPEVRRLWKRFRQLQAWWEYGTETVDWNTIAGLRVPIPAMPAHLWGVRLDFGPVDIVGEWVDTHARGFWYTHYVYKDGYTYEGLVLGHPYGYGAQAFDGRLRWHVTPAWRLSFLPAFHRWRFRHVQREQRDFGGGLEAEWIASFGMRLRFGTQMWAQDLLGSRPAEYDEPWSGGASAWAHASFGF